MDEDYDVEVLFDEIAHYDVDFRRIVYTEVKEIPLEVNIITYILFFRIL